jgi:hypothetical protein
MKVLQQQVLPDWADPTAGVRRNKLIEARISKLKNASSTIISMRILSLHFRGWHPPMRISFEPKKRTR